MAGHEDQFERVQLLSAAFDPIIDICMLFGVHTAELETLLRVAFVKRVASTLSGNPKTGKGPSHEQVGLAAGLHRSEVQNIRSTDYKNSQLRLRKKAQHSSKAGRVIDLWKTTPRYLNASGSPLALPLDFQAGSPSFEELVEAALPGKRHLNVLKDLRRRGLVQLLPDEIVRLPRIARPLPSELSGKSLSFIADQMRAVGNTLLQNILAAEKKPSDPLGVFVSGDPIEVPDDAAGSIRALLQERIAALVQGIERDLIRTAKSKKEKSSRRTLTVSAYTVSTP